MKRLTILTVIVTMTLATTGCCKTWSLFRWTRGDACATCGDIGPYDSIPVYEGGLLPPPSGVSPVLPEPQAASR